VRAILIESPDRFAHNLAVQLAGHDLAREHAVRSSDGASASWDQGPFARQNAAPNDE
jgi:hypothetical protein